MRILLTGGAGYIGSHVALGLLQAGFWVTILDNLSSSAPGILTTVRALAGGCAGRLDFVKLDIRDSECISHVLRRGGHEAVLHLAGLKDVAQSTRDPLSYFDVNFGGTRALLSAMAAARCMRLVFSSSAAVYGDPAYLPIDESHPCAPRSPYGLTKLRSELAIAEWVSADPRRRALTLRYFNPVGCFGNADLGLYLSAGRDALMNRLVRVARNELPSLEIYGADYDTPDGTCLRDFVDVQDLAQAHVSALTALENDAALGETAPVVNIGRGEALSVLQFLRTFERLIGRTLPLTIVERRAGDSVASWAQTQRAETLLRWRATRDYGEMCRSVWAAQEAPRC